VAEESPEYQVVERLGEVEIRDYEPYLVAEVDVEGDLEDAGSQGFRVLAGYIFGANRRRSTKATAGSDEAPSTSAKIAMTTPVTQQGTEDRFTIRFMMPSAYSPETLPEPTDERITITEVPARRLAAVRYSGRWTAGSYQRALDRLVGTLADEGLTAVGEPLWARYDPPFKPWFLRRNEVLTEFTPVGDGA
jgi:effector-binding domain-containing protein